MVFFSLQKCHFLPNVCPRIGFKQTAKHVHLNAANDTHQKDLKWWPRTHFEVILLGQISVTGLVWTPKIQLTLHLIQVVVQFCDWLLDLRNLYCASERRQENVKFNLKLCLFVFILTRSASNLSGIAFSKMSLPHSASLSAPALCSPSHSMINSKKTVFVLNVLNELSKQ